MFRAVVLFCAVLALTKGQTTPVNQCSGNSPAPRPLNTYIAGCTAPPCELPQGQNAVVEIIFRAPRTMHTMKTSAFAYLGFIVINYDLEEKSQTCNFLANTYCPVVKDEVVKYSLQMPIQAFMPVGTMLPIEFRIADENDQDFMCIRVTVRITPPVAPSVGKLGALNATMSAEV